MATDFNRLQNFLDYLDDVHEQLDWKNGLRPKHNALPPPIPRGTDEETIAARWQVLPVDDAAREVIADDTSMSLRERFRCNVENFIGTVKVPVGVAGPLRINGMFAQGDYYYPLATTEATLVASYNRGARVISEAGGCTTVLAGDVGELPHVSQPDSGPGCSQDKTHPASPKSSFVVGYRTHNGGSIA